MKQGALVLLLMVVLMLAGCLPPEITGANTQPGLRIIETVTSIGASEDDPQTQVFSYRVTLQNGSTEELVVGTLTPVLVEPLAERVLVDDTTQVANMSVEPGALVTIGGQVPFNSEGWTKEDIDNLGDLMTSVHLTMNQTLPIPVPATAEP